jgi:hypothetical protein
MIRASQAFVITLAVAHGAAAQSSDRYEVPPPFGEAPIGGGIVVDRGWSVSAFWIGVFTAAGVLATGIAAAAVASPDDRVGTGLAVGSMSLMSVAGPTVALGGASARGHPYVPGARGVRIAAWLIWSLSLVTGISALATDIDESDGGRAVLVSAAGFGALGLVLFALDALVSAIQADLVTGSAR